VRVICLTATSISNQHARLLLAKTINLAESNKKGQEETPKKKEQQKYNRERKGEKPQYDKERGKEGKKETPRKIGRGEKLNS